MSVLYIYTHKYKTDVFWIVRWVKTTDQMLFDTFFLNNRWVNNISPLADHGGPRGWDFGRDTLHTTLRHTREIVWTAVWAVAQFYPLRHVLCVLRQADPHTHTFFLFMRPHVQTTRRHDTCFFFSDREPIFSSTSEKRVITFTKSDIYICVLWYK